MARRVQSSAAIRAMQNRFDVKQFCERHQLVKRYEFAIRGMLNLWAGDLDADEVEKLTLIALATALKGAEWIEEDLRERFNLPLSWQQEEKNWDAYREAIAVSLLQLYYDGLP